MRVRVTSINTAVILFMTTGLGWAQMSQQSALPGSQWQMSVDVIKTKAQMLSIQNTALTEQYDAINTQINKLTTAIADLKQKNEALHQLLKDRNGKTDQQIRLEELTAKIKTQQVLMAGREGELNSLDKKVADTQKKIDLKKLKISDMQLRQQSKEVEGNLKQALVAPAPDQSQLDDLRKKLENEKTQEVMLEKQFADLKASDQRSNTDAQTLDKENKALAIRLGLLRDQKAKQVKAPVPGVAQESSRQHYYMMRQRKAELEEKIRIYEIKADGLRESLTSGASWPAQKKRLIHDMVQADAHNQQIRSKINDLREDIVILKEQIAKLERRANAMRENEKKR